MSGRAPHWKKAASAPDAMLKSWLEEPGSLTRRCRQQFSRFAVQPVFEGFAPARDGMRGQRTHCRVREVLLLTDGQPFIFAHSVLSGQARGPLGRWLRGLGGRSLGSLLFHHPGFRRGPLSYARLDARDALYQSCRRHLVRWGLAPRPTLWARRCEHRFAAQQVRVIEVFAAF